MKKCDTDVRKLITWSQAGRAGARTLGSFQKQLIGVLESVKKEKGT